MNINHEDVGDVLSGLAILGVLADILPTIAALAGLVWTLIRIYEWIQYKRGYPSYKGKE